VVSPVAEAVTVYGPPAVPLAVNGAAATPDAFVATVIEAVALAEGPRCACAGRREGHVHSRNRVIACVLDRYRQCVREGRVDCGRLRSGARVRRHRRGEAGKIGFSEVIREAANSHTDVVRSSGDGVRRVDGCGGYTGRIGRRRLYVGAAGEGPAGVVKVTVAPLIATLPASRTVTAILVGKAVLIATL
jgi:hypothetical protein